MQKMSKSSENLRLCDAIVTFDELSTANIYHVQLLHPVESMKDAISCFNRSVQNLCQHCMIASSGDYATRYLIVSHVTPACFEHLLTRNFNKLKTSSLFNITF